MPYHAIRQNSEAKKRRNAVESGHGTSVTQAKERHKATHCSRGVNGKGHAASKGKGQALKRHTITCKVVLMQKHDCHRENDREGGGKLGEVASVGCSHCSRLDTVVALVDSVHLVLVGARVQGCIGAAVGVDVRIAIDLNLRDVEWRVARNAVLQIRAEVGQARRAAVLAVEQ